MPQLIAINIEDPLAPMLHDIEDVEVHLPGTVDALHTWLKLYKSRDGIINRFAFEGKPQGRKFAEELVEETHEDWLALVEEVSAIIGVARRAFKRSGHAQALGRL